MNVENVYVSHPVTSQLLADKPTQINFKMSRTGRKNVLLESELEITGPSVVVDYQSLRSVWSMRLDVRDYLIGRESLKERGTVVCTDSHFTGNVPVFRIYRLNNRYVHPSNAQLLLTKES